MAKAKVKAKEATKRSAKKTAVPPAKRPRRAWRWKSGDWKISTAELIQSSPEPVSRCYDRLGVSDVVANFTFRLDQEGSSPAEVKFIYSGANRSEEYRVDFMYGLSACRITAKKWAAIWPLDLVIGKEYRARIRVRSNVIKVDVDGMSIVPGFGFGRFGDGVVGFGTWSGAATFNDISLRPYEQRTCFVIMPFDRDRKGVSHPGYVESNKSGGG